MARRPAAGHGDAEGGGAHGESPWAVIARLFNFAILAGGAVLPAAVAADGLPDAARRPRAERADEGRRPPQGGGRAGRAVEARMKALPGEIDALKRRGAEEITAEEARIQRARRDRAPAPARAGDARDRDAAAHGGARPEEARRRAGGGRGDRAREAHDHRARPRAARRSVRVAGQALTTGSSWLVGPRRLGPG